MIIFLKMKRNIQVSLPLNEDLPSIEEDRLINKIHHFIISIPQSKV